jgi:16S rRNA (guanine527-N7)-methyltransferase
LDLISKYFPTLTGLQSEQFARIEPLYRDWNAKINLVSRHDISNLMERHVLHSLGIAKAFNFAKETDILDAGTGGGFPGIPLAIFFPDVRFHLVDSVGKKIIAAGNITDELGLQNVTLQKIRVEEVTQRFDFIIARAVATLPEFYKWTHRLLKKESRNSFYNGIIYLKGGDVSEELGALPGEKEIIPLGRYFEEEYFKTKVIVYLH